MKPQTQGVREEKGATQIIEMTLQDPREMNYEVISVNKSPSLTQGEDKEVSGELNGNSPRFPKDGFPPLSEQGDNICQIK